MKDADLLILHASQLATCASPDGPKRGAAMADAGIIPDGAVAIADGQIIAVGSTEDVRSEFSAGQTLDASGKTVCPGFVDPHTHLVFTGDRLAEFERRIEGATYMQIMKAGGGIVSTMRATRDASLDELVSAARSRLDVMLALGTTSVEVKTGYGLDTETEIKMLRAIEILEATHTADLLPTFLGAHAVPPEYADRTEAYVDLVIEEMLPAVSQWYEQSRFRRSGTGLFCDVFCEENVFSLDQVRRILVAGKNLGFPAKIHADEFNHLGGARLAVELEAVSVDHLDVTPDSDLQVLARSDTLGVVLPAVNFNLGSAQFANARRMIDLGIALSLATDINPGSAPCPSIPLVMAIASRYQRLLPAEALNASTINAAHAIGMGDQIGSLEVGKQADLLIVDAPEFGHLAYRFGDNLVQRVVKRGRLVI